MKRSLALRLTLAFLFVGVIGVVLVAVLVAVRTRAEFDRFVASRDQVLLAEALVDYYTVNGSWDNVGESLSRNRYLARRMPSVVLLDADQQVIWGLRPGMRRLAAHEVDLTMPLEVDGRTVGYLLFNTPLLPVVAINQVPPETDFLRRVSWATTLSAAGAVLTALLLGGLLARTLTRPIRELTAATRAMAGGALGRQVTVHADDELGELATAFNQMSSDLARASQLRKQMTADIAHDLRNPLSILRGYTEGLQDGRIQGSPQLYAIMHSEVRHLGHLIDDLRTLSLADAGELPLQRRAIDPKALLERTALAYLLPAQENGVAVRVEAPDDLPSISVDGERFTQVLNNLVTNALRHTAQGEVVLGATAVDDRVALSVRDSGEGIPAEDLPFIFHRFYRADKARPRGVTLDEDGSASGLGLAIAKAIVEAHGGAIQVASTPGQGAIFTITLAGSNEC
jgi:two-component system, OmpR family, sensor histidine kinase BaeS